MEFKSKVLELYSALGPPTLHVDHPFQQLKCKLISRLIPPVVQVAPRSLLFLQQILTSDCSVDAFLLAGFWNGWPRTFNVNLASIEFTLILHGGFVHGGRIRKMNKSETLSGYDSHLKERTIALETSFFSNCITHHIDLAKFNKFIKQLLFTC